jgi:uncharacterized protein involved in type VI secretion and phage assembly
VSDRDLRRVLPLLEAPRLAEVTSVDDPSGLARVRVRIHGADADAAVPLWARVAVPFAGAERGAFLLPDVGDTVLVVFVGGDPMHPVVVGGLWTGSEAPPETVSDRVDRWTFTGKAGTRIAILEDATGSERVEIETPNGARATVSDRGGGRIVLRAGGATVTLAPAGVTIETGATVSVDASVVTLSASMMSVDCPFSSFSGVIQCDTLIATSVISSSYTPGAGNVW